MFSSLMNSTPFLHELSSWNGDINFSRREDVQHIMHFTVFATNKTNHIIMDSYTEKYKEAFSSISSPVPKNISNGIVQ